MTPIFSSSVFLEEFLTVVKSPFNRFVLVLFFAAATATISQADTITINPTDDGSIYTCSACVHDPNHNYVLVSGYIVGEVVFSTASFNGQVGTAFLSVNPYAMPLWGPQMFVYGRASTSSTMSISDLASPTYLGTWTLPADLNFHRDAFFDVTSFLQSVNAPYVDIILKDASSDGSGTDVFSSTQYNYGHPSQLTVTNTPEPATWSLLLVGLIAPAIKFASSRSRQK
ncbi:MAG: hypothetical protein JWN45_801 [Acidobacteriaceae bacterium]|nr:hypothetical protein [Acidobacteriaceae bacterium]